MPSPLTRLELDEIAKGACPCCGDPYSATNPPRLDPKCCPRRPVHVDYWDGVLMLYCAKCGKPVIEISVKEPPHA